MNKSEEAERIVELLRGIKLDSAQNALQDLGELVRLIGKDSETDFEVGEARASLFMAIGEVAAALHRATPAEQHWVRAIQAAEHWNTAVVSRERVDLSSP